MMWHGAFSVFRFELRRTLTVSRIAVWLLLVLFPVFIVSVMKYHEKDLNKSNQRRFEILNNDTEVTDDKGRRFTIELERFKGIPQDELPQYIMADVMRYYMQYLEERSRLQSETPIDGIDIIVDKERRFPIDLNKLRDLPPQELRQYLQEMVVTGLKKSTNVSDAPIKKTSSEEVEQPPQGYPTELWSAVFFGLIPEVITLFSLLLWVTPLVHSELEGRTWIYLAVRPRGRVAVLLGKYMSAVAWTVAAGWLSVTICVFVARPADAVKLWATIVALVGISSIAYAALYSLIGVWLHRRAMVIAVAYTLIFELLVSLIPAVINKFTVQYRLRNLFVDWTDSGEYLRENAQWVAVYLLGDEPTWLHMLILIGIVLGILAVAAQIIQRKEYVSAVEA